MNDFQGFETSMKELTTGVVEIARDLKLEMKLEDVAELLECHDKL